MFDRFTHAARDAMGRARQAADHAGHDHIGPVHMLLGILAQGDVSGILTDGGVDPSRLQVAAREFLPPKDESKARRMLPFTKEARVVLRLALEEATSLEHRCVGTEHLLLGLLRLRDQEPHRLPALDLTIDRARQLAGAARPQAAPPRDRYRRAGTRGGFFDRFNSNARKALSNSRLNALRLGHGHIGSGHIVLGLLDIEDCVARDMLRLLDPEIATIRREVAALLPPGDSPATDDPLPFTPGAKRILELALEVAEQVGDDYVGTEHLLLGVLRKEDGVGARALHNAGVTLDAADEAFLDVLGADPINDDESDEPQ